MHPLPSHASPPFRIRFCADVTRETCLQLQDALAQAHQERQEFVSMVQAVADVTPELPAIHLHVTSDGGDLLAALNVYDHMSVLPNLHTHVEGMVASAATLLTVPGSVRSMRNHSLLLVHQPSIGAGEGARRKYADARDEYVNLEYCTRMLLEVYAAHTELTIDQLSKLLSNEQCLTARQSLHYGFVDAIEE